MSRKNIFALVISGLLLFQVIVMVMPYIALLNPADGLFWRPIEYTVPPKEQTIYISGMKSNVTVVFDNWGVPHIYAQNLEDAFTAFGYVQARDRLFQMDLIRRLMEGRLSEIFGDYALNSDIYYRTLGLAQAARASIELIEHEYPEVYDYMVAFARGVNQFINEGKLPLEMVILGYTPYKWEPYHSLLIAKMIEYGLTFNTWDLKRRVLVEAFGENRVEEIFPPIDYILFPILQDNETWYPSKIVPQAIDTSGLKYKLINDLPNDKLSDVSHLINEIDSLLKAFGFVKGLGSNNWVVSGNLTDTGKPLLANDPHLPLNAPPVWYEAHIVVPGVMNVRGVTFPGIPFIIIGHNDKVAWGVTNGCVDVIDFYYYKWLNATTYYYNGSWVKVNQREETIKVRTQGGYYNKTIIVNETIHGPLIEFHSARYAVKWTGLMATREAVAVFKFDTAKNIEDFLDGLRLFDVPGQNFVYADVEGNIMYYPNALYPIRKNLKDNVTVAGNMPFNGSNLEGEWVGFIPFEDVPHALNVPRGYIVTANNWIVDGDYPYYIGDSYYFLGPYRAMRITQMILDAVNTKGYVTIDDFKRIQSDAYSTLASALVPLLLDSIKNISLSEIEQNAVNLLKNWDYTMTIEKAAPTIFAMWVALYREYIFADEYEEKNVTDMPLPEPETIHYMSEHPNEFAWWFDNKTTDKIETMGDIAYSALREAIKILTDRFDTNDPTQWTYGKIHVRYIQHFLGGALPWLNYPEMPENGSWFTVNLAYFEPFSYKWVSTIGPSWRQIIDLSNFSNSLSIIPGGQSGNPYSPHYYDQYLLWIKKEYKPMTFPSNPSDIPEDQVESILYIQPGG